MSHEAPKPSLTDYSAESISATEPNAPSFLSGTDAFRLLVESVKDYAIFILDPRGVVSTWNAGAKRIKGYTAKEIIGKHFSVFYTDEAKRIHHPEHELEIAAKDGRYEEEGWRVRKDGTTFWANVVITTLYNDQGEVQGFAKVTRDMTERKKLEDELRAARDLLEQRVEQRTLELTRANQILQAEVARRQQLEDSLRQQTEKLKLESEFKDDFLAMLAHELRNPMGALSNALHVLLLGHPGTPAFERAKEVAIRQMNHHTRLVDDLLDVSRLLRDKIKLRKEVLDLSQVLREVIDDHHASLEQAEVTPYLDLPPHPVEIAGDRTRLTQVFGNLIDNSRKFTLPGGQITIRLDSEEPGWTTVAIRDTGIGIEPSMLPRLFQQFTQADRSLERSRGGLGLGLALVKGLTELHGGTVTAQSGGIGQGAEFIIRLPLKVSQSRKEADNSPMNEAAQRLRVLVIEDLPDAAESLRDLLEIFGYEVEVAFDGQDGIQKALAFRPAAILCDIGLPGLDGYAVASELRQNSATAFIPLIAVTGYGKEEDRQHALDAGFNLHLTKPVKPTDLCKILDDVIHKKR